MTVLMSRKKRETEGKKDRERNTHTQVELSKHSDGYLHIGDRVCLLHVPTKSVVSAHVTSARAFDATSLEGGCEVTCSRQLSPCPRNVFVITRCCFLTHSLTHVHGDSHTCTHTGRDSTHTQHSSTQLMCVYTIAVEIGPSRHKKSCCV